MTPEMAPEWVSEKIQTLKYQHIIYHFKARDLEILYKFREIFNFLDFMNTLRNFSKFEYLAKSEIYINGISQMNGWGRGGG